MNEVELRKALIAAAERFANVCIANHDELDVHGSYDLRLNVDCQGTDDDDMPLFGATELLTVPRQLHEKDL